MHRPFSYTIEGYTPVRSSLIGRESIHGPKRLLSPGANDNPIACPRSAIQAIVEFLTKNPFAAALGAAAGGVEPTLVPPAPSFTSGNGWALPSWKRGTAVGLPPCPCAIPKHRGIDAPDGGFSPSA